MRRVIFILSLLIAISARADEALQFFTNQANPALQTQFGFGVTNIPIYSSTNGSVRYSAALHYVLQAAANAYDVTTPATNYPSVFRPVFGWQGGNLFIVGYTNVTSDFDGQFALGFKNVTDPSIATNDNVWGVPWVVGAKDNSPQFNEYQCANVVTMARRLWVLRSQPYNGMLIHTNQLYEFGVSNVIGLEAWNTAHSLTTAVEMVVSNQSFVIFTNNYNWGTNLEADSGTDITITNWPASQPYDAIRASFVAPILTNLISLSLSQWSDSTTQMVLLSVPFPSEDTNLSGGLPVHAWELRVTNNFTYALLDKSSGANRLLDFVNLAGLGSVLNLNQALMFLRAMRVDPLPSYQLVWQTNGASDAPDSPPSTGVQDQMLIGEGYLSVRDWPLNIQGDIENAILFQQFLAGSAENTNDLMECPFAPATTIVQYSDWPAANPKVHYTAGDLTNTSSNDLNVLDPAVQPTFPLTGNLGEINPSFISAAPRPIFFDVSNNYFQISFAGVPDLPYMIWSSTNLADWSQLGTAAQPAAGVFQFDDGTTNTAARFYKIVTP